MLSNEAGTPQLSERLATKQENWIPDKMEKRCQIETSDSFKLELAGFVSSPPGWDGVEHTHPFWELIYLAKGEGCYLYCKTKTLHVKAPVALIVSPETPHQFKASGTTSPAILYIGFSWTVDFAPKDEQFIMELPPPGTASLQRLAKALVSGKMEMRRDTLFKAKDEFLQAAFETAQVHLKKRIGRNTESLAVDRGAILIEKVKAYLTSHLDQDLSVEAVGRSFYLSPHYLSNFFKERTGMSIKQYHTRLRMEEARRLLLDGQHSVSSIADLLGFGDAGYFSRRFARHFGRPPSSLR